MYKPKQWIERFRQYIKRTERIDIIELINEEPITITDWTTNYEEKVKEECHRLPHVTATNIY